MFRTVLSLVACVFASLTSAQSLQTLDQRGEILGWEAIGRLDSPFGFCTATLISDDTILTAAHCLYGPGNRPIQPEQLVFRAGYSNGVSIAERKGARIAIAPGYRASLDGKLSSEMIAHDVALVRLESAISSVVAPPFRIHETPEVGDQVSVVSYGQGREEALSRQGRCKVEERYRGGIMQFDCDVTFGSSGAPVFVRYGTRVRILSLISGGTNLTSRETVSFGMTLPDTVTALKATLRNGTARRLTVGDSGERVGARRITVGERNTSTGARFVRP